MAGLKFKKSMNGHNTGALERYIVKSGTKITAGDPVILEAGYLDLAAAGEVIFGVAAESIAAANADGAKTIEILMPNDAVFEITSDEVGTSIAQAHMGTYFDITGASGAVLLDTSTTTTSGQLVAKKFNGTTVEVMVHERQI